jgi:hypothetical protein
MKFFPGAFLAQFFLAERLIRESVSSGGYERKTGCAGVTQTAGAALHLAAATPRWVSCFAWLSKLCDQADGIEHARCPLHGLQYQYRFENRFLPVLLKIMKIEKPD